MTINPSGDHYGPQFRFHFILIRYCTYTLFHIDRCHVTTTRLMNLLGSNVSSPHNIDFYGTVTIIQLFCPQNFTMYCHQFVFAYKHKRSPGLHLTLLASTSPSPFCLAHERSLSRLSHRRPHAQPAHANASGVRNVLLFVFPYERERSLLYPPRPCPSVAPTSRSLLTEDPSRH